MYLYMEDGWLLSQVWRIVHAGDMTPAWTWATRHNLEHALGIWAAIVFQVYKRNLRGILFYALGSHSLDQDGFSIYQEHDNITTD